MKIIQAEFNNGFFNGQNGKLLFACALLSESTRENYYQNHFSQVLAYHQGYLQGFWGAMYKPKFTLTQLEVIHHLERNGCYFIASACLREWAKGNTYYIDTRVTLKNNKKIRALMNKANREVLKNAK